MELFLAILQFAIGPNSVVWHEPAALSPMEREIASQINSLRQYPAGYAAQLAGYSPRFRGRLLDFTDVLVVNTTEGAAAVDEAAGELSHAPALPALILSPGLCRAARRHVEDQGPHGVIGHIGSDGATPTVRARSYAHRASYVGENIIYGTSSAAWALFTLVVDDGIPSRGHRRNFLLPNFRYVGVACGPHAVHGSMCVIDFAAEYEESPAPELQIARLSDSVR